MLRLTRKTNTATRKITVFVEDQNIDIDIEVYDNEFKISKSIDLTKKEALILCRYLYPKVKNSL